jgi:pyruvate dehydrogenase E1 component beta subunit
MVREAMRAAEALARSGIEAEVIDLRSISPWDRDLVFDSVKKTGTLVVADAAWKTGGVAAEIAASVAENVLEDLKAPIARVCLPDTPAPTSTPLEEAYYVGMDDIIAAAKKIFAKKEKKWATGSPSLIPKHITAD